MFGGDVQAMYNRHLVPDSQSTNELMKQLHTQLRAGVDPMMALLAAQRANDPDDLSAASFVTTTLL